MAKRFTSTDIWKEDWFLELPQEYMLAWFYIKDNCNHAGIWKPNKRQLEFITRTQIDLNIFLSLLNNEKERVVVLDGGSWYLLDFISFQYGNTLNENNRVHASITKELNAYKIDTCNFEVKERSFRPQDNPNQGVKDKDKVKDKDIAKDKFTIPTEDEVLQEMLIRFAKKDLQANENKLRDEAEQFMAYYNKVGWVVGKAKTKMKDWKGAVTNWFNGKDLKQWCLTYHEIAAKNVPEELYGGMDNGKQKPKVEEVRETDEEMLDRLLGKQDEKRS